MGNTYETDRISDRDEIALALAAAMTVKTLGNMIGCHSWLTARLSLRELLGQVDKLTETIRAGSKAL
jgi:hypothetical protein